jgi:hypothetical protein
MLQCNNWAAEWLRYTLDRDPSQGAGAMAGWVASNTSTNPTGAVGPTRMNLVALGGAVPRPQQQAEPFPTASDGSLVL